MNELKVGIAEDAINGGIPVNGLRHLSGNGATGWYIWAGENMSEADDYFIPMHVRHLQDRCPVVLNYLGLPPGWRFLIAEGYQDVWYDKSLFNV